MPFAIKPQLVQRLERVIADHGRQAMSWFTADEAYGDNPGVRTWLEQQQINYVMAISCDGWYRHITLSMLAAAFLAVTACQERDHDQKGAPHPSTNG